MPAPINLQANLQLNPASVNASARQVQQALGRITGQASEFQKSLDASTARVFAFGATTAVIAGVGSAFKSLVRTTVQVQDELIKMNAILGASQKEFGAFRDAVFNAAKSTGQSFQTAAGAAQELARQGLSAAETSKRLESALVLTRISGLTAEQSVRALTAAINGFQSAGLTAVDVTNKIVAVDTRFAVSAQDLADGFSRAGSTAEDAGVSFNELLGLITAVEQRTARGGAVIGNAFKSIFTRLSRGTTIEELKELGVQIDAGQSGVQKLEALSKAIENIADPTTVSKIKELAGGVFQINVVSAALKDLSNETSIYQKATEAAATAGNDGFERNQELSKSLASQINKLVVSLTDFASKVGDIAIAPLLEDLVSLATKFTDFFGKALDGDSLGGKFISGFFGVIGKFLSGPALVMFGQAFLKITAMVAKFAIDGFKSIMKMGSAAEKVKNIESGIVDLLLKDKNLRSALASKTLSQAQKEDLVLKAMKAQNKELMKQQAIISSLAQGARRRGVRGFDSNTGKFKGKGKGFASGYQMEEFEAMMLGASPTVNAHKGQGTIGGRSFIMNDQEVEIPNFGRNGDSAVIPLYASGNMPRYANGKFNPLLARSIKLGDRKDITTREQAKEAGYSAAAISSRFGKPKAGKPKPKGTGKKQLPPVNADGEYGMIVPEFGRNSSRTIFISKTKSGITGTDTQTPNSVARVNVPIHRVSDKAGLKASSGQKMVDKYTNMFTKDAIQYAKTLSGGVLPSPVQMKGVSKTLNKGSAASAAGSVFESGIGAMLGDNDFKDFKKRAASSLMDFRGGQVRKLKGGKNPFKVGPNVKGLEAKYSSSLATGAAEKIYKILELDKAAFASKGPRRKASGYMPRFGGFQPLPQFSMSNAPKVSGTMGSIQGMNTKAIEGLARGFAKASIEAKKLAVTEKQVTKAKQQSKQAAKSLASAYGMSEMQAKKLVKAQMAQVQAGSGAGMMRKGAGRAAKGMMAGGGMGGMMAFSVASMALDGLAESAKESGNAAGEMAASAGSAAMQGAAMGMMFGPLGAAIGAATGGLLSFATSLFNVDKEEKELEEQNKIQREKFRRLQQSKKIEGNLQKDFGMSSGEELLKKAEAAAAAGLTDYTSEIKNTKALLNDINVVGRQRYDAERKLASLYPKVARQFSTLNYIKELQKHGSGLAKKFENFSKKLDESIIPEMERSKSLIQDGETKNTLLGTLGDPTVAGSQALVGRAAAQNKINTDLQKITLAGANLQKAKMDLAGVSEGSEGFDEAKKAQQEANKEFENTIRNAATNLKATMNEIGIKQKQNAIEIENLRKSRARTGLSGLATSFTDPSKFNRQGFKKLSERFNQTSDSQSKGKLAAQLQTMLSGMSDSMKDFFIKDAGLDMKGVFAAIAQNQAGGQLTAREATEQGKILSDEAGGSRISALSIEQEALSAQMKSLAGTFQTLQTDLDVGGIVSNVELLNQSVKNSTANLSKFAESTVKTQEIAQDVVSTTNELSALVSTNLGKMKALTSRIKDTEDQIAELKKKN